MQTFFKASNFFDLESYAHSSLFYECEHVWEALAKIETYLGSISLGAIEVDIPSGVFLENSAAISIGKGTIIEAGAYIQGPCKIGARCQIRHGAYLRGNVLTGDGCVIGHTTEVKNSIFLNGAHAAHFAYIGDSILGNQVNLGAGTKCANLKLNNKPITISYHNSKWPTGQRKMGAILGDGSQTGCNSVLNPGTIFGKEVICYPCINVGGVFPSKSKIKLTTF